MWNQKAMPPKPGPARGGPEKGSRRPELISGRWFSACHAGSAKSTKQGGMKMQRKDGYLRRVSQIVRLLALVLFYLGLVLIIAPR